MGIFYKPSSYRKIEKYLNKNGFVIRQDGGHMVATHSSDSEIVIAVPRHTTLSNGTTQQICKKLIELGHDEREVRKAILK